MIDVPDTQQEYAGFVGLASPPSIFTRCISNASDGPGGVTGGLSFYGQVTASINSGLTACYYNEDLTVASGDQSGGLVNGAPNSEILSTMVANGYDVPNIWILNDPSLLATLAFFGTGGGGGVRGRFAGGGRYGGFYRSRYE